IGRCLSFQPAERPSSAGEVASVLWQSLGRRKRVHDWVIDHLREVVMATFLAVLCAGIAWSYSCDESRPLRQFKQGWESYHRGQYGEAVRAFNRVLKADPRHAQALFARGRAHQQMGEIALARADYEQADQLATDGRIKACLGYCWNRKGE